MKKTIVVADKDEKVQQAFMTIFSKEQYTILWAPNGKDLEKIAAKANPDIYLVNISLPKLNGIEVHRKLQKEGRLDRATFFFLKDEADVEPLGIDVDGVIEKPINFFRVYETLTGDDEVIELTDLVEEKRPVDERKPESASAARSAPRQVESAPLQAKSVPNRTESREKEAPPAQARLERAIEELPPKPRAEWTKGAAGEEGEAQTIIGRQLRQAMETVREGVVSAEETDERVSVTSPAPLSAELQQQLKAVLNQAMEEAADKLSSRLAPILTRYVEDYVRQMLLEITEKVIREEIDKLLKESIA